MRTTLTIDDDVARLLDDAVHRERRPLKQVVNDALRRGLAAELQSTPFRTTPHRSELRPGIDPASLNRLVDELEVDAFLQRTASTAP